VLREGWWAIENSGPSEAESVNRSMSPKKLAAASGHRRKRNTPFCEPSQLDKPPWRGAIADD